ncbi:MAG: hypothetical protein ACPGSD_01720 [Flavobacteriales bacterium]
MTTEIINKVSDRKSLIIENQLNPETTFGDILRIEIQGNWKNYELATFLIVIEDIYQLFFALTSFQEIKKHYLKNPVISLDYKKINLQLNYTQFEKTDITKQFSLIEKVKTNSLKFYDRKDLYSFNFSQEQYFFRIIKLKYNSPGNIDFFGVGKVLEFVQNFVKGIINFSDNRKTKKVELEILKENLKKEKIENAKSLFNLMKEMKCDNITMNEMNNFIDTRQDKLIDLVLNSQITDIKIIDKDVELEK